MQVSAGMTGDPVLAGLTNIRNHGCTRGEFEGNTERQRRQATTTGHTGIHPLTRGTKEEYGWKELFEVVGISTGNILQVCPSLTCKM